MVSKVAGVSVPCTKSTNPIVSFRSLPASPAFTLIVDARPAFSVVRTISSLAFTDATMSSVWALISFTSSWAVMDPEPLIETSCGAPPLITSSIVHVSPLGTLYGPASVPVISAEVPSVNEDEDVSSSASGPVMTAGRLPVNVISDVAWGGKTALVSILKLWPAASSTR